MLPFHLEEEPHGAGLPEGGRWKQGEEPGSLLGTGNVPPRLAHVPRAGVTCGLWPITSFLVKLCFVIKKAEQISAHFQV